MSKKNSPTLDQPITQRHWKEGIEMLGGLLKKIIKRQDNAEIRLGTLEKGQGTLEKGQAILEKGQGTLEKGQAILEKGQGTLEKGQSRLEKGQAILEKGQAILEKEIKELRLEEQYRWEKQWQFNEDIMKEVTINTDSVRSLDARVRYQEDMPEKLEHVENQQYALTRRVVALENK